MIKLKKLTKSSQTKQLGKYKIGPSLLNLRDHHLYTRLVNNVIRWPSMSYLWGWGISYNNNNNNNNTIILTDLTVSKNNNNSFKKIQL